MNMRTSVLPIPAPITAVKAAAGRYLSCLRLQEILVLQGSPLLGAAFAIRHPTVDHVGLLTILIAANVCLMAHVFLLNDWSGLTTDLTDPNKASSVFTARGVGSKEIGGLTASLLALSLLLFSRLGPGTLCLALAIAILSALYSLPCFNWKGRPLLSSAAHLVGGVIHFFGQRRTFAASLVLFTLAQALLFLLALQGTLPRPLAALVVLYPLHLRWSFKALAEGLTFASMSRLQARYRALYAIIGLAMVAALCGVPGHPQRAKSEDPPQVDKLIRPLCKLHPS